LLYLAFVIGDKEKSRLLFLLKQTIIMDFAIREVNYKRRVTHGGYWSINIILTLQEIKIAGKVIPVYTVKPVYAVNSIKKSPVIKGHLFLVKGLICQSVLQNFGFFVN
jgi:hypothetical protein